MPYTLRHLSSYVTTSAQRHPDRIAVVDPAGRSINYRDLAAGADRIAAFLSAAGIGPGERVGVMAPKSVETVVAILGVLRSGAAYVPVDPMGPIERGRTILSDCRVSALFIHGELTDILNGWGDDLRPRIVVHCGRGAAHDRQALPLALIQWDEAIENSAPAPILPDGDLSSLAYLLYTSGSTGTPKGVQISHAAASSFVEWSSATFRPTEDDCFSSHAPFHFDLSIFDLYVALRHAASVHLIGEDVTANPRQLAEFMADRNITIWYSTPSALTLLGQHGRLQRLTYRGPRLALFAGEVFPIKHLRQITQIWPDTAWYNLYGPTETNVCTFAHIPVPIPEERTEPFPIGVPCDHCDAIVLREDGTPATNEEGVLHIAGPSVCQGYWNRPAENTRAFRQIHGRRYYDTGDVVRLDAGGELIFLGRRDRMVKRHGYRIELGEVETALYKHPQLRQVGVVALTRDAGVRIIGCFSSEEPPPSIIELKQFSSQKLPMYMVPDEFRRFPRLPITSTGKTDYQRLSELLLEDEARS